jgi:hypothetical protein
MVVLLVRLPKRLFLMKLQRAREQGLQTLRTGIDGHPEQKRVKRPAKIWLLYIRHVSTVKKRTKQEVLNLLLYENRLRI